MCSSTRSDGAVLRAALAPVEEGDVVSRALLLLFYFEHHYTFRRRELRMLHHVILRSWVQLAPRNAADLGTSVILA